MTISITKSSRIVALAVGAGLVLAVAFSGFATSAQAALSASQVQSILSLLQSFGADAATIANVNASLTGGTPSTPGTGTGSTVSCNISSDLTMGSSGLQVTCLQQSLIAMGFSIPAGATGYFGAQTQSAVAKWQMSKNISPAAGYFGPVSRAAWAAGSTPSTPGTGTGTTPGLSGSAGSITVTSTATDVEDEVLTGETQEVLGFKAEASGSDLLVSNVRVKFTAAVDSAASDRLSNYADEISIWANGQKVGTMDADSFTRDSAGVYTASIPVSQVIRMGSGNKVTFHVGFKANSSIDSDDDGSTNDWTAQLLQVRYTDATGAVLFDTTSVSNAGIYVSRASSSTDVKLRMGEGSNNPKTSNIKVSTSNSTEITLVEFTLKAEGSDMYFDELKATTTVTGVDTVDDIASDFYLMKGSDKIAEVTAASTAATTHQVLTFDLDDTENIDSGDTATYKIVAKIKSINSSNTSTTFGGGDSITASTSVGTWNINAKAATDGKQVTERTGSVTSYVQTLYNEGIQVMKVSESFTHNANDTLANSTGEFKVTLRVTNFGSNDVYIPLNATASTTAGATGDNATTGAQFYITDGTTSTSTGMSSTLARVSGGTEKSSSVLISGGQSADFMLTVSFNPDASYTGVRQYRVQVGSVGHASSDTSTASTLVKTLPAEDFRTSYYTVNN